MIETIKKSFKVKITESFYDGFRGHIPDKPFSHCVVRDKKILKNHLFEKQQEVTVTLELVDKVKPDNLSGKKIEFYVVVHQTATNGIYTKEFVKGENPHQTILFYQSRGMITSSRLTNNDFGVGEFVKITIK